jgi:hypothetical protein
MLHLALHAENPDCIRMLLPTKDAPDTYPVIERIEMD